MGNVVQTGTSGSAMNAAFKGTTVAGHPPAGYVVPHLTMMTLPNWAMGNPDKHDVLPWDSE